MQYTGLKDKNGKEIYSDDICLLFGSNSKVLYHNGCYGYIPLGTDINHFISFSENFHFKWNDGKSKFIQVIGNIHENPELIG